MKKEIKLTENKGMPQWKITLIGLGMTIALTCMVMFVVRALSDNTPIGDIYIANVTYVLISNHDGINETFEDSFIWETPLNGDCMPTKPLPPPNFSGNIYVNSTVTMYVLFESLQYVKVGINDDGSPITCKGFYDGVYPQQEIKNDENIIYYEARRIENE